MTRSRFFVGRKPTRLTWVLAGVAVLVVGGGISAVATPASQESASSATEEDVISSPPAGMDVHTEHVTATPTPETVVVPDASTSISDAVTTLTADGLKPAVIDASGTDVSYLFSYIGGGGSKVFVSQDPSAGTAVAKGTTVTVHVRDPKEVISADFSGPGGVITSIDGSSFSQVTDAPQHWEKEVPYGDTTKYTFTNPYAAGTLTCTVTQEGVVMQTNSASGPFASTSC